MILITFMVISWALLNVWLHPKDRPGSVPSRLDVLKVALSLAAGAAATVALFVNFRRQQYMEQGRFDERFAAAATLLGSESPAERLAGVYAIANLADETINRRQQCINFLCAYMRLPYSPDRDGLSSSTYESVEGEVKQQLTYEMRPHDRQVRLAIVEAIRLRLQSNAKINWFGKGFDFTGATFDGGNFHGAIFTGRGTVSFERARFVDGWTNFDEARFEEGYFTFREAIFDGGRVTCDNVRINSLVELTGACFNGSKVTFSGACTLENPEGILTCNDLNFQDAVFKHAISVNGGSFNGWPDLSPVDQQA